MSNYNLFYPSMVKFIMCLKDENNTTSTILKDTGMIWIQIKKSLELLYMYDFIDLEKIKNKYNFELTKDGKKLRDHFCSASALITKHRNQLGFNLHGYKSKEEMIQDVKKDIISDKTFDSTTTTFT